MNMDRTKTATESAYDALKAMILDNTLKPSASYLESELADRLGVSRTPAREAMLQLAREGLVEVRPRHGMRVLPISAADMDEIYMILTELEPLAAELAARRNLSPKELAPLDACIRKMETALEEDDRLAWAQADDDFHAALVRLSGSKRLERAFATFADQVYRARMATLFIREKPVSSNADHRELVERLKAGDAEGARRVHRRHRETARRTLVGILEKHRLDNL